MLAWTLLIVVLLIVGFCLFLLSSVIFGRGESTPAKGRKDVDDTIAANHQAVTSRSYSNIEFDVTLRGYRQDEVDALIVQLIQELEQAREINAQLLAEENASRNNEQTSDLEREET